jgi:mevalonate pyrophosphate decarboxylase
MGHWGTSLPRLSPNGSGLSSIARRTSGRASRSRRGELLECFQWSAEADVERVKEELADVLTYCLLLAQRIGADPEQIVRDKLAITREKYPVDKSRGRSAKYDSL